MDEYSGHLAPQRGDHSLAKRHLERLQRDNANVLDVPTACFQDHSLKYLKEHPMTSDMRGSSQYIE